MEYTTITFACACGALWSSSAAQAGRKTSCPRCKNPLRIPLPGHIALPSPSKKKAPVNPNFCSICQTTIANQEPLTNCKDCQLPFHSECWQDNFGCSAYGCSQVNCLKTGPEIRITIEPSASPNFNSPPPLHPQEGYAAYLFLAANIFCFLLGLFLCGVPPLLCALTTLGVFLSNQSSSQTMVYLLGIALGLLGLIVGIVASSFFYGLS